MSQSVFSSEYLPEYHERLIIVKMRASAFAQAVGAGATAGGVSREWRSPGWAALSALAQAGMIQRVIPLTRQSDSIDLPVRPSRALMEALTKIAGQPPARGPTAGAAIIELEQDQDVADLQRRLGEDPTIEFASRVPIRYLIGQRRVETREGGSSSAHSGVITSSALMWNLRQIHWSEATSVRGFEQASDIKVAVLDTGIDAGHPDLQGRVEQYLWKHPDFPDTSSEQDLVGHGTHVAGILAARGNNGFGIRGICECRLCVWKVFRDQPRCEHVTNTCDYIVDPAMYRQALNDCVEHGGINVLNLSLGGRARPEPVEEELFRQLLLAGTTIVAAMGNERTAGSPTCYPAAIPGVIAVGATGIDDAVAHFSSRGNHISLCAPGVGIWSTVPTYPGQTGFRAVLGRDGGLSPGSPIRRAVNYDAWDGTSMAAPHVAGAAALLLAKTGKLDGADVRTRLMDTADRVKGMGKRDFDLDYGAGRLNLERLLADD